MMRASGTFSPAEKTKVMLQPSFVETDAINLIFIDGRNSITMQLRPATLDALRKALK